MQIVTEQEYIRERLVELRNDLSRIRRRIFATDDEGLKFEEEITENEIMDLEKQLKVFTAAEPICDDGGVHLPPFVINDSNPVLALSGDTIDWGMSALRIPQIHQEFGLTGKNVKVAVIDCGTDTNHEDLIGAVIETHNTTSEPYAASNGHGTACSTLIGARKNDKGILSVAPDSQIIAIKALMESGSGNMIDIVEAVNLAIDRGAQIISMSLGGSATLPALKTAIQRAANAGIYVICAAGNAGQDNSVGYPGKYPEGYAVAATNQAGKVSAFSSRGPEVDIAAPGERILCGWNKGGYATVSGTSFATPLVSGCYALFIEAGLKITPQMIRDTAIDIEEPGSDLKSGAGLINPYEIIKRYMNVEAVKCAAPEPVVSQVSTNRATISWPPVSGAFNYSPEYKPEAGNNWNDLGITKAGSVEIQGLSAGNRYNFRIRTNCSNGISAFGTLSFSTEGSSGGNIDLTKVRQAHQLLDEFIASNS